jgi:hypothetical protein
MTSIVIPLSAPLGFGSRNNDIELRYCLRSIEKHLSGYGDIFLVGHKPKWINDKVIHIPAEDEQRTWWKERNIYRKILLACEDPRVSDDFLFMNDDHYLLADYVAGEFPYYWEGELTDYVGREDQYGNTIRNTFEYFTAGKYWAKYFDIHSPILYNKGRFEKYVAPMGWNRKYGYSIKTSYCVYWPEEWLSSRIEYPDLKINQPLPPQKVKELLTGRSWFSVGNKAFDIGGGMERVLQELYPNKSKYEC